MGGTLCGAWSVGVRIGGMEADFGSGGRGAKGSSDVGGFFNCVGTGSLAGTITSSGLMVGGLRVGFDDLGKVGFGAEGS